MDSAFQLKERVTIEANGIDGEIVSIWFRATGDPLYEVRYCDRNGLVVQTYFEKEALTVVK